MLIDKNLDLNRYEWASSFINNLSETKPTIYDIGAKDSIIYRSITKNIHYQGFDLNPEIPSIHEWDLNNPQKDLAETCDYILFLEVIEHLNNPWNCISNLSNVLKTGGRIILTTPNPFWSESRFTLFHRGIMQCFTDDDLKLNHHVFTPWPHIIEKLLNDHNLIIEEYVTLDGRTKVFDKNLLKNPFRFFKRLIKKYLEYQSPASRGMSYGIIAKKL